MRIGRMRRLALLCAVAALLPAVQAVAAVDAYMTIDGSKQGAIKGEATRAGGMPGEIHLTSVQHQTDAASGMSAGKRQHGTITIVKETDAASPKLFQAMSTNEVLTQVVIVFSGAGTGGSSAAQKIVLTNATITNIQKTGNTEHITLEYPTIEVTHVNGGKSATDDWLSPS